MDTRTTRRPVRDPADDAADRRIEARYWSLPHPTRERVDCLLGWHLLMGGGRRGEAQLEDAIRQAGGQS